MSGYKNANRIYSRRVLSGIKIDAAAIWIRRGIISMDVYAIKNGRRKKKRNIE